jgi:uncharacterized membrane protein YphA (DoxX/SURF4 family)
MRKQVIIYWCFTGLLILLMGVGSIPNIMSSPGSVAVFEHLGYPAYLLPFLGVAKLLGVVAIVVPGYPRLKEWAYAGFMFDLSGAMYSTIAVGDASAELIVFVIGYVLIAGSYVYYHKLLKAKAVYGGK